MHVVTSAARLQRPVLIPGSLDGIETGGRRLIRAEPLETMVELEARYDARNS